MSKSPIAPHLLFFIVGLLLSSLGCTPEFVTIKTLIDENGNTIEVKAKRNQLITNTNGLTNSAKDSLENYLKEQGFEKIDSCICSDDLSTWEIDSRRTADLIGIVEGAPKTASGVGDSTGLSPNYEILLPPANSIVLSFAVLPIDEHAPPDTSKVIVAILDSGVDPQNPNENLQRSLENEAEAICGSDISDFDSLGTNMINYSRPIDEHGHGTMLNGIIAGSSIPQGSNNDNVNIEQLNVKVTLDTSTSVTLDKAVCGMYYAIEKGAYVMNLSWGYYDTIPADILTAVLDTVLSKNAVIVAGAGNDNRNLSGDIKFWPADLSDSTFSVGRQTVIKVGAYNSDGTRLAQFSNYPVEVAAPGVDVISTAIIGETDTITAKASGTSYAAPYVTRRAAIIIGNNGPGGITSWEIKQQILSETDTINSGKGPSWPTALKFRLNN